VSSHLSEDSVLGDLRACASRLAGALAERIAEVVPDTVQVSAANSTFTIGTEESVDATDIETIVNQGGELKNNIEAAALLILSDVQDFIAAFSKSPWPFHNGEGREAGPPYLPYPHAEWSNDYLRLFFGEATSPNLELRPITLEELTQQ
jgi:hypothetical protein